MKCQKCTHFEACNALLNGELENENRAEQCEHFSDKNYHITLPCKLHQIVYRKDGPWNVVGFDCDRGGGWRVKLERWKDEFIDCHESVKIVFGSFGKTIFTSPAEADAKFQNWGR